MQILKFLAVMMLLVLSSSAFAKVSPLQKARIDSLVSDYYLGESKTSLKHPFTSLVSKARNVDECEEDQESISCIDVACDNLGTYGCNDMSEIEAVARACKGNRSGKCLKSACDRLGVYGCNDLSEIENVAQMCKGHFSGRCIDVSCGFLGTYGCNDQSEIESVTNLCKGTPAKCIESTCKRLGTYGCNDLSELEAVAENCRGE